MVEIYQRMCQVNDQLDRQLSDYLKYASYRRQGRVYSRDWFNRLPDDLAAEVVHYWLAGLVGVWGRSRQIHYLIDKFAVLASWQAIEFNDWAVCRPKPSGRSGWAKPQPANRRQIWSGQKCLCNIIFEMKRSVVLARD